MASKMTKRGIQDNIVTYEHICDTTADLQNIDPKFITLGSVAVVLEGDGGMEFYMANSNKKWLIMTTSTSGGGGSGGASSLEDLSDINISNPINGQIIKYNDSSEKWENTTNDNNSSIFLIKASYDENTQHYIPDKTFAQAESAYKNGQLVVVRFTEKDWGDIILNPIIYDDGFLAYFKAPKVVIYKNYLTPKAPQQFVNISWGTPDYIDVEFSLRDKTYANAYVNLSTGEVQIKEETINSPFDFNAHKNEDNVYLRINILNNFLGWDAVVKFDEMINIQSPYTRNDIIGNGARATSLFTVTTDDNEIYGYHIITLATETDESIVYTPKLVKVPLTIVGN